MKYKIMLFAMVLVLTGSIACFNSDTDIDDERMGESNSGMEDKPLNVDALKDIIGITAENIDGKWTGQYDPGAGGEPMNMEYTFKAEGAVLKGTSIGGANGEQIPILDGKIEGNKISFALSVDVSGQELKFNYTGELSGDKLYLNFELAGGGGSFTVERAK